MGGGPAPGFQAIGNAAAAVLAAAVLAAVILAAPAARAGVGEPGVAVPIHDLGSSCEDPRYPALAGPWIVGCGADGRVDRALSLASGRELSLPRGLLHPGLAEGLVVGVGREAVILRLTEGGVEALPGVRVRGQPTAPPATDGRHLAMVEAGKVSAWPLEGTTRRPQRSEPPGWYPPALSGDWLAWSDDQDRLWRLDLATSRAEPERIQGSGAPQRHVVGSGQHLAWVEGEDVVLLDLGSGEQRTIPARTGFSAPLALWQDVVCWEQRPDHGVGEEGQGVDIRCSDGLEAAGPGHQRWPSRWGPYLLYRSGGQLWLRTAPAPTPQEDTGAAG